MGLVFVQDSFSFLNNKNHSIVNHPYQIKEIWKLYKKRSAKSIVIHHTSFLHIRISHFPIHRSASIHFNNTLIMLRLLIIIYTCKQYFLIILHLVNIMPFVDLIDRIFCALIILQFYTHDHSRSCIHPLCSRILPLSLLYPNLLIPQS